MTSETKRRLLLSKWEGRTGRAIAAESVERLLDSVSALHTLVARLAEQDEKIATLEADLEEKSEELATAEAEKDEYAERLETALRDVKYWMLEPLVHHQPMRDPRKILRQVEDALG